LGLQLRGLIAEGCLGLSPENAMDRGVKIAIFVASIVSLGLGLIWDQVLNHAREVVAEDKGDGFHSEKLKARIGPKDLQRQEIPAELAPDNVAPVSPKAPESTTTPGAAVPTVSEEFTEYVVREGDIASNICHRMFKDRNLTTVDLAAANPGIDVAKIKPGMKLKIPKKGTKRPTAG
jgi:hypothetical protein